MFLLELIYNIVLLVQVVFFSSVFFFGAWKHRNGHPYTWLSSMSTGILSIFSGASIFIFRLIPYPYVGFMSWWSIISFSISIWFMLKVRRNDPEGKITINKGGGTVKAGASGPVVDAPSPVADANKVIAGDVNDGLATQHEWLRKAFHLAGFLVIFAFYIVGPLLAPLIGKAITGAGVAYTVIWGPIENVFQFTSYREAGIYLTLFSLVATVVFVSCVDYPRVLVGEKYSMITLIESAAGKILREKEIGVAGPETYIALGATSAWIIGIFFQSIVPFAMEIAIAGIMISTLADGMAAIIGKSYGKHKIKRPHDQVKSVEGFIAGTVTAFVISIIFTNWLLALIGAGIFLLIDYISPPVADNVINAPIVTIVLCLVSLLLC
ncbi:MAG: hypothetical protein ACTSUE_15515 [Promethearchaeota archaeon]